MSGLKKPSRTSPDEVYASGGSSCALVCNQPPGDPGGWLVDLYAEFTDQVRAFVARYTLTAAGVAPATLSKPRVMAMVTVPGARGFYAEITPPAGIPATQKVPQFGVYVSDVSAFGPVTVAP